MVPTSVRVPALAPALAALALCACALTGSPLDRVSNERMRQIEDAEWIGTARVQEAREATRDGRRWLELELEDSERWKGSGRAVKTLLAPLDGTRPASQFARLEGAQLVLFAQRFPGSRSDWMPTGGARGLYLVRPGEDHRLIPFSSPREASEESLDELREVVEEWVAWDRFERETEIRDVLDELERRRELDRLQRGLPSGRCALC